MDVGNLTISEKSEKDLHNTTERDERSASTLLLKEGIRKVLENDLPLVKDGITPEGTTCH